MKICRLTVLIEECAVHIHLINTFVTTQLLSRGSFFFLPFSTILGKHLFGWTEMTGFAALDYL